jgi:hypothetical protein
MRAVAWAALRCVLAGRRVASVETGSRTPSAQAARGSVPRERLPRVSVVASTGSRRAPQARPAAHAGPRPSRRFALGDTGAARTGRCPPTTVPACSPATGEPQATAAVPEGRTGLANRPVPRSCPSRSQGNTSFGLGVDHLPRRLARQRAAVRRGQRTPVMPLTPARVGVTVTLWR